jgi:hypothetical protein
MNRDGRGADQQDRRRLAHAALTIRQAMLALIG